MFDGEEWEGIHIRWQMNEKLVGNGTEYILRYMQLNWIIAEDKIS